MKKIAPYLTAALVVLGAASQAHADDVKFTGFAHGSQSVTYTLGGGPNTNVSAGGFTTILNGGPSFTSYCIDLAETINFGTLYQNYIPVGSGHVFANSDAYADLGRLYAVAGPILDAVHEAAFQIAVWEITYETDATYGLGSGVATFNGTAAANGFAAGWLASLGSAGNGPAVGVLDRQGSQDVIYAPVPEPSTVMLMLAGFVGMATVARRRSAKRA